MKKQGLLILCFFSLLIFSIGFTATAQQARITGKVTDASTGEGIPGASVLVKGTTRGMVTDLDGNYSIEASSTDVLVFSFIGYNTVEETVGTRTSINLALSESIQGLNEAPITPSITIRGSALAPKEEIPRSLILNPPLGLPPGLEILRPATLPWSNCLGSLTVPWLKSSALILATALVISFFS